jgi:hypothetical protein
MLSLISVDEREDEGGAVLGTWKIWESVLSRRRRDAHGNV